ncbi:MAG: SNF2-related protein [Ignavibacteriae bacterium]|nr:SNF2-related protein [Ignavibacteriota bacterium]
MPNIPFRELSGEVRALFIKNSALCTTDYNSYRAGFGYEARVVYREVVTPTSYGHTDTWVNKILINEKDEIDLGTFAKHFKTPEVPHLRTVYSEIYGTYRKATELVYNRYELHKYQFQIDDMPLLLMKDKGVLAYQQGLGKSLTALVWLRMKEAIYPDIRRSLTIVQQNLIPQWVEEARRVGTVYEILPLDPLHMSSKKHYITHYEFITKHYKTYLGKFQAILIDEGHKIKSPKSHRGRAIRQLDTPYKLCLTGTPIKNIMEDIHFLMGWTVGFKNNVYPYGEDEQTKLRKEFAS